MTQAPVIIKTNEYEIRSAKSDFVSGHDISKALHQSGSWYLLPRKYCFQRADCHLDSLVFHVCSKSWIAKAVPDDRGVEKLQVNPYTVHRTTPSEMKTACQYCGSVVPEDIIGLWTLHNWDILAKKDHSA